MNKYIIPICDLNENRVYNLIINARSTADCQDKIMVKFSEYSDSDEYHKFVKDLDDRDIIIGKITDIEEL